LQQLVQLHKSTIEFLKNGKNLLAFSAGVDSSALFFILKSYGVEFDIAIVDYNLRQQSKQEVSYAKKLCLEFDKVCYLHSCKLENSNFEHNARAQRYNFFEKIIEENSYDNLITAHQLNDKLEWFLMQLGRGSGLVEMLGMQEIEFGEKFNKTKPLLHVAKEELQNFLDTNKLKYFIDESNSSQKYLRNRIRSSYANSFIKEYKEGLKKSFDYLQNDASLLLPKAQKRIYDLFILKRESEDLQNIRQIDKIVKKMGILMSKAQRDEVAKTKDCVISGRVVVVFGEDKIYISPYDKSSMPKKFKESCRLNKIPNKIRPYLYAKSITFSSLHYKL